MFTMSPYGWSLTGLVKLMLFGKVVDFLLTPFVQMIDIYEQYIQIKKERELRLKRKHAKEQLEVMRTALYGKASSDGLTILVARYGATLHEHFDWDSLTLPELRTAARTSERRNRKPSDWDIEQVSTSEQRNVVPNGIIQTTWQKMVTYASSQATYVRGSFEQPVPNEAEEDEDYLPDLIEGHPDNINVAVQLQFLIKNDELRLPHSSKSVMLGFYNPIANVNQ